jgi:hypothetical protein
LTKNIPKKQNARGGGETQIFEKNFQLKNFLGEIFFWVEKVDQYF